MCNYRKSREVILMYYGIATRQEIELQGGVMRDVYEGLKIEYDKLRK